MNRPWSERLDALSNEGLSTVLSLADSREGAGAWLPTSSAAIEDAQAALRRLPELAGGRPAAWLDEIAGADPPLARLVEIKRAAKELIGSAGQEDARTAAILVYHTAVAAAFARQATVISSTPLGPRLGLYDGLAVALGQHPLGRVFRAAVERFLAP